MTLAPGLHPNVPAGIYHGDEVADEPTFSKSIAHTLISRSPLHAFTAHPRLNPAYVREEEDKFVIGTVAHALLLQGLEVAEVMSYPDWRSGEAKLARELARTHGRIPILLKQWSDVQAMCESVATQLEQLPIRPIPFTDGQPEVTIVWEEQGVLCRCRLDWLSADKTVIDDLKTTHNANPAVWTKRTMWDIGAHLQYVLYRRAVKAVTGQEPDFRFIVVEPKPPFAMSIVGLPPAAIALANDQIDSALATWKRCLETGKWPGYPQQIAYPDPPAWMEAQWLEREVRDEVAA